MKWRRTLSSAGRSVLVVWLAVGTLPRTTLAQVPAEVEIRDGRGSTLVRNASRSDVNVELAVWESDETGERVVLLEPASISLWPTNFRLRPGETQTVRFLVEPGAYVPHTLLRLESRFIPVVAPVDTNVGRASERTEMRLRLVTRILSKVFVL